MNFESLGMIEMKGLLPSIEAADAMLKAANVNLFKKEHAGAGLTMIMITGNVSAVKSSLGAGYTAAENTVKNSVINICVIPRPDDQVIKVFSKSVRSKIKYPDDNPNKKDPDTWVADLESEPTKESNIQAPDEGKDSKESDDNVSSKKYNLLDADVLNDYVKEHESGETLEDLKKYRVADLKDLFKKIAKNDEDKINEVNKSNKSDVLQALIEVLYPVSEK